MKARYVWPLMAGWAVLASMVSATQIEYTYDVAGRLVRTDYGGGTRVEYTYDANGNLLIRSASSGGQYILIYNAMDGGSILGAATQNVAHGAAGSTVTALTNQYFQFVEWSDGRTAAARADTNITANAIIVAQFAAILAAQGTPHWWLAEYGYSSNFNTAELSDDDEDGFAANKEFIADTNPTNAASYFRVTHIDCGPPVVVHFEPGSTGRVYSFQFTDDLKSGSWTHVSGVTPRMGHGGEDSMSDTNIVPARSHRILVEHP